MNQRTSTDRGFSGLEAAIVLIAFVVIAAVFTYVLFGARSQDLNLSAPRIAEPAGPSLQVIGDVYGYGTGSPGSMEIDKIQFYVGLAPRVSSLDLSRMIIVISQPDVPGITQLTCGGSLTPATFTVEEAGTKKPLTVLNGQTQGTVLIELERTLLANHTVNIELRPPGSQTVSFSRTAGATIVSSQVL